MKKFKDIKVGDTVYVYGGLEPVQELTVTYIDKIDINNPHDFYHIGYGNFGSKPKSYYDSVQASCGLNDKGSTFGCFSAVVYFNQEDVIKRFDEDIKTLERYKQEFINKQNITPMNKIGQFQSEKSSENGDNEDLNILQRFSFYSYKDEPNILYLAGLYVNDEHRNKGIGTKILKIANEVAISIGCNIIRLKTQKDTDAERFYRKNGYNTLTEEGNQVWLEKQSTLQVRTGLEWINTVDDACDKRYSEEYAHGEYCHEQSFKWGFQEGVEWFEEQVEQKPQSARDVE